MIDKSEALRRAKIDLKNKLRLINNHYGDMSPINNDLLPGMPKGSVVVIAEDVHKIMDKIQKETTKDKREIPFLLYGKNEGQLVFFDKIDVDWRNPHSMEADFSRLAPKLNEFVNKSKKDGTDIIAHGHSHPEIGGFYHCFSLKDMDGYKNLRMDNEVFKMGKIELCSCLLTDGNTNFLFFDGNDYYKFNEVFVQAENGDFIEQLPCYKKTMVYKRGLER